MLFNFFQKCMAWHVSSFDLLINYTAIACTVLYGLFIYLFFKLSVFVYVLRWIQFIYWGHTCVYILYAWCCIIYWIFRNSLVGENSNLLRLFSKYVFVSTWSWLPLTCGRCTCCRNSLHPAVLQSEWIISFQVDK